MDEGGISMSTTIMHCNHCQWDVEFSVTEIVLTYEPKSVLMYFCDTCHQYIMQCTDYDTGFDDGYNQRGPIGTRQPWPRSIFKNDSSSLFRSEYTEEYRDGYAAGNRKHLEEFMAAGGPPPILKEGKV